MGHRITQRIYECNCCGNTPEDGEYLWEMCGDYICEKCFDDGSYDKKCEAEEKENKNV